ncbi:hypothetical protein C7K38_01180 [Tetragenococcus osmophilus]|uniref:Uncharacterized protein n=1 Tax=Tetragenococcus osmophilus TaxID=526944 RepID=A0AA38CX19_9ENTE|nr:hypothetical protein [Tetragenococcus osmophilus]AYW47104.1 hypothetical protein C7K38_01180 [Tetragenococcus osmophilus]GMA55180.1 hypothetical protein GCM10025857_65370 [Alicyclobacillus contaminans]GMA71050.1 hypothetical protein GCM10025885_00990 [Tetragenococcus osmophilus]
MKNKKLMFILGVLVLARPLMKITGFIDVFGNEAAGSILMTLFISLVWIGVTAKKGLENPIQVLIGAGICYATFATIGSGIFSPLLDGRLQGPLTNPIVLINIFLANMIWGLITGYISAMILKKRINKKECYNCLSKK